MISLKSFLGIALATATLGGGIAAGVSATQFSEKNAEVAEAAVSHTASGLYIQDQVGGGFNVLSIEYITFSSGYSHSDFRVFLTTHYGAKSASDYVTTSGTDMPTTQGWSYNNGDNNKYLVCLNRSKSGDNYGFNFEFPDWVTELQYKVAGNKWWNWMDIGGNPVRLHSGYGLGHYTNGYIYNSGGWQMNANPQADAFNKEWGDISVTLSGVCGGSVVDSTNTTIAKYYKPSKPSFFGYTTGDLYKEQSLTNKIDILTADTTVYAKLTMNKVAFLAGTMNGWSSSDDNYLMVPAENSQYTIDVQLAADVEFKVVYNGNWYGWSDVDSSSSVVNKYIVQGSDPDSTGYRIKVKTAGKYEIYFKTNASSNRIWIQQDSASEATTWAQAFLDATNSICSTGGTSANHLTALQGIWSAQKTNFEAMTEGAKGKLIIGTENATIKDAHDRYEHIMKRYNGSLSEFGSWTVDPSNAINPLSKNTNNVALIAIISAFVVLTTAGTFLIIRKKKHQ